ncbi:MAG TPA: hypothetical protein DCQ14_01695, partial [Firmicutes bacterium]|nr:hypothetical protein [Bacillota bacterium]
ETIFLFILRLLYDEKRRDLRLTQQVIVTGQEIMEKYLALQIKNRLPAREVMQRILKMFNGFSLLDLKRGQWREPEAVFVLYPSLLLVLNTGDLESLAEWLKERAEAEAAGGRPEGLLDREDLEMDSDEDLADALQFAIVANLKKSASTPQPWKIGPRAT